MKRFIFCNTGWMNFYKGLTNDPIKNGGEHVKKYGWGGEIFNFEEINGRCYGYVEAGGRIHIERLGAETKVDRIDEVTIIWTATHPEKQGTYVVGWYKNATLFRERQKPSPEMRRTYNGNRLDYYAVADSNDCYLIPSDDRKLKVKRGKDGMGEKNIWYANSDPAFIRKVSEYILNHGKITLSSFSDKKGTPKQKDPFTRIAVEKAAIKKVVDYYTELGYKVYSVEKDNVGWDLNAVSDSVTLKLEVKGLSGIDIVAEFTPNEFKNLKSDKKNYRICIVTEALTDPKLKVFSYLSDTNKWRSPDGTVLNFEQIISARIYEYKI